MLWLEDGMALVEPVDLIIATSVLLVEDSPDNVLVDVIDAELGVVEAWVLYALADGREI